MTGSFVSDHVFNLSKKELAAKEISALEKGLGVCTYSLSILVRLICDEIFGSFLEKSGGNGTLEMKYHKAMRRFLSLRLSHNGVPLKVILL